MKKSTKTRLKELYSDDRDSQNEAFTAVIKETDTPVDWAYEVWDEMLESLGHKNNRRRAIAAQILCNLAKSDPKKRMLTDFDALLAVTKDERFVTARHTIQAIWKVGAAGKKQRELLFKGVKTRFRECEDEKNCTLVRYDFLVGLRKLYDETGDGAIRELAGVLMDLEKDLKYRKKYAAVWKSA